MPYEWHRPPGDDTRLHLWPYRSLPRRGFVIFIAVTAGLMALPLVAVLGLAVWWFLLPFLALAGSGVWLALGRSYRDGERLEILRQCGTRIELVRHEPGRPAQRWTADPYWVTVQLHRTGGPVPNYLTLKGASREVEIGAFLSEAERLLLLPELTTWLAEAARPDDPAVRR